MNMASELTMAVSILSAQCHLRRNCVIQKHMFSLIHLHIPVVHSQQHVTTAPRLDTIPFDEAGYALLVIEDKTLELLLKRWAAQIKGGCSSGAPY